MTLREVRRVPLLADIDASALRTRLMDNQIYIRQYAKGVTVHDQHDICMTLDIVLSGSLAAYSLSENGSAMTLFTFEKDSILGANLLYGDIHTYPLNIYCVTPCTLLHLTKSAVTDFLHNYQFTMRYIKSLSHNSQGMNQKITILSQKTLRENLTDYLTHQSIVQRSHTIVLPISKKELADYMGVQRPSLFRELKRMKNDGLIEVDNRVIKLKGPSWHRQQ